MPKRSLLPEGESAGSRLRAIAYNVFDVLLNVVIIVAVVAVIRTFILSPFEVEGNSMVPTLEDNQYIIINKIGYYLSTIDRLKDFVPKRGDVVVFRPPTEVKKYYVKRIIGVPGDTITIENGSVSLHTKEGKVKLEEGYLDQRNTGRTFKAPVGSGDMTADTYEVPEDHYFLLGDNRQGSLDSRSFRNADGDASPFVHGDLISGRVWFIALPITKSHALETPVYEGVE